jgi:hypothetical protein
MRPPSFSSSTTMSNESEPRSSSQHVAYRGEAREAARIHPLAECHIGAVADFTHLAIIDHIDAAACLLLHDLLDCRSYPRLKSCAIKRLATIPSR